MTPEKDNRIEVHERIACLEVKINELITNHLPHTEIKIDNLEKRIWWILGTVVIGQLATLIVVLLK